MNTVTNTTSNTTSKTRELVLTAIFVALTYAATWLLNIRLPFMGTGGLIHLGNVPLFAAGMLFGKKTGFWAGALGMGLFDLMSGWTAWAPFTFVIVGAISEKAPFKVRFVNDLLCVIVALIIKIVGYYFAEVIITSNWYAPLGSIPGNIIQVGVAGVVALVFVPVLRKVLKLS